MLKSIVRRQLSNRPGDKGSRAKIRVLVLAFAVVGAILLSANVAGAGGATTTPFKFTAYGVSCSGAHILKTGANAVHKESETCIDTVGYYSAGTYSLGPGGQGWFSDYHIFVLNEPFPVTSTDPKIAIAGTLVVTDNGNGTFTWNAVSYYP